MALTARRDNLFRVVYRLSRLQQICPTMLRQTATMRALLACWIATIEVGAGSSQSTISFHHRADDRHLNLSSASEWYHPDHAPAPAIMMSKTSIVRSTTASLRGGGLGVQQMRGLSISDEVQRMVAQELGHALTMMRGAAEQPPPQSEMDLLPVVAYISALVEAASTVITPVDVDDNLDAWRDEIASVVLRHLGDQERALVELVIDTHLDVERPGGYRYRSYRSGVPSAPSGMRESDSGIALRQSPVAKQPRRTNVLSALRGGWLWPSARADSRAEI